MLQTKLLKDLLRNAEEGTGENSDFCLGFVTAVAFFCSTKYTGLCDSDESSMPEFEEERLRYLCGKTFKSTGRIVSIFLKRCLNTNSENGSQRSKEELISNSEKTASSYDLHMLSAEIVFLEALASLSPEIKNSILKKEYKSFIAPSILLNELNQNIENYVISKIEKIEKALCEKKKKAINIRDWRPSPKIEEIDLLKEKLHSSVSFECENGILKISFPFFFSDSDSPLVISAVLNEDGFLLRDNGCAVRELIRHKSGSPVSELIIKDICAYTVCGFDGSNIFVSLDENMSRLTDFLQTITHVANADLLEDVLLTRGHAYDGKDTLSPFVSMDDTTAKKALITAKDIITNRFSVSYDDRRGTFVSFRMCYPQNSTGAINLLTLDENGDITVRDYSNSYNEGAIFEHFLWNHDNFDGCEELINCLICRFGGILDKNGILIKFKNSEKDSFARAMYRFTEMAVLASGLGYSIKVPYESEGQY